MAARPEHTGDQTDVLRALTQAVYVRGAIRRVHDAYPPGRAERRIAAPLLRALDLAVCRQVRAAHAAGLGPTELAGIVGVNRSRVGYIVRREREREREQQAAAEPKHGGDQVADVVADALPADVETDTETDVPSTARAAHVAELQAADAGRAAVRATPPSVKRRDPASYNVRRRAARTRLCRALHAAHDDGMTVQELAAVVDLGTAAIRSILASAY